jgi:hypothetical protein
MPVKYVLKPKTKEMPCRYCNLPITVGWKTKKIPAHIECAINAMTEQQIQMHRKSGPYYDAWLARMRIALGVDDTGTLGSPNNVSPTQDDD